MKRCLKEAQKSGLVGRRRETGMVGVGSAVPHCQLVARWTERSSQGSLQWFPCHSVLLGASLGYGSREISPCFLHSKTACCGTQLVILPSALIHPAQRQRERYFLQRQELLKNKICPSNLWFETPGARGTRELQLRCSRLSDPPRQLCLGMDTQLPQLLDSFLRPQSSAGAPNRL